MKYSVEQFRQPVQDIMDRLTDAVDRRVCAEIDASCCRTSSDYTKRNKMLDEEATVRDSVEADLMQVICEAIDCFRVGLVKSKEIK